MLNVFHFILIQTICYFMQDCSCGRVYYRAVVSVHSSLVVLLVFIDDYIVLILHM